MSERVGEFNDSQDGSVEKCLWALKKTASAAKGESVKREKGGISKKRKRGKRLWRGLASSVNNPIGPLQNMTRVAGFKAQKASAGSGGLVVQCENVGFAIP